MRVRIVVVFIAILTLSSCATPVLTRSEKVITATFPSNEFSRVLSKEQQNLTWENISKVSQSLVWRSSDMKLIAITRSRRAIALIEPGSNWTTYYLFGSSGRVMKYKVNSRDVEGAVVDFVYEAL